MEYPATQYPLNPPADLPALDREREQAILETVDVMVQMAESILDACTEIKATVRNPKRTWAPPPAP